MSIKVKDAVRLATEYFDDLFQLESLQDLALEGIEKEGPYWVVTLGFFRPWDIPDSSRHSLSGLVATQKTQKDLPRRTYKAVRLRESDGELVSIKNRE